MSKVTIKIKCNQIIILRSLVKIKILYYQAWKFELKVALKMRNYEFLNYLCKCF